MNDDYATTLNRWLAAMNDKYNGNIPDFAGREDRAKRAANLMNRVLIAARTWDSAQTNLTPKASEKALARTTPQEATVIPMRRGA